jgi:hypothetical protein
LVFFQCFDNKKAWQRAHPTNNRYATPMIHAKFVRVLIFIAEFTGEDITDRFIKYENPFFFFAELHQNKWHDQRCCIYRPTMAITFTIQAMIGFDVAGIC